MRTIVLSFAILISCCQGYSQINEMFTDGDLTTNPPWSGDLTDFTINAQGQLQLFADSEGESQIYTMAETGDSIEWEFYFKMNFSPSGSNRVRIYLMLNQIDISLSNGYFVEVGETGSEDALKFYRLDGGVESFIASASMGALAEEPAGARFHITLQSEGLWTFTADYTGGSTFQLEFEVYDDQWFYSDFYFAIQCIYTASRTDQFFFDDIIVREIVPDTSPPVLEGIVVSDPLHILLSFNEVLNPDSVSDPNNFSIAPGIGIPASAEIDQSGRQARLTLQIPLESGIIYTVSYHNIADPAGNTGSGNQTFFLTEEPQPMDLVINEILFDPYPGGSDFVELFNRSEKFITLEDLEISNYQNGQSERIDNPPILAPGEYIVFTEDTDHLLENYSILDPEALIENELPSFNNDEGNCTIHLVRDNLQISIDSFDYSEEFHFELLNDTEGVSLERIGSGFETNQPDNWQSAASVAGYATPGYENSNSVAPGSVITGQFELEKKIFSPNSDGIDDLMILRYDLETSGYILNLKIFDSKGRLVRELINNQQLSTSGIISWDGIDLEGRLANIGIYVLWIEIFRVDGTVSRRKMSCVLADYLDR